MEHRPLSPAAHPSGRSACLTVACGVLLGVLTLLPGPVRAAAPAAASRAAGAPGDGAMPVGSGADSPVIDSPARDSPAWDNPAGDMPTGDEAELASPPVLPMSPAAASRHPAAATTLASRRLGSLIDRDVVAPDGSHVGQVIDVLLDQAGHPAAAVVDVGGFLGVGNRRIAIAWDQFTLGGMTENSPVKLRIGAADVRSAPAYDAASMNVTVVHGPPPPPAPPPVEAAPPPVSVEAQPQPQPQQPQLPPAPPVPDSSGHGGGPADPRPHSARAGQMVR
jgi:PRC-barrel domain